MVVPIFFNGETEGQTNEILPKAFQVARGEVYIGLLVSKRGLLPTSCLANHFFEYISLKFWMFKKKKKKQKRMLLGLKNKNSKVHLNISK